MLLSLCSTDLPSELTYLLPEVCSYRISFSEGMQVAESDFLCLKKTFLHYTEDNIMSYVHACCC